MSRVHDQPKRLRRAAADTLRTARRAARCAVIVVALVVGLAAVSGTRANAQGSDEMVRIPQSDVLLPAGAEWEEFSGSAAVLHRESSTVAMPILLVGSGLGESPESLAARAEEMAADMQTRLAAQGYDEVTREVRRRSDGTAVVLRGRGPSGRQASARGAERPLRGRRGLHRRGLGLHAQGLGLRLRARGAQ